MLDWIAEAALSFELRTNGHREYEMSVASYLMHQERVGVGTVYAGVDGRKACIDRDQIWELRLLRASGVVTIVGPDMATCLETADQILAPRLVSALAA